MLDVFNIAKPQGCDIQQFVGTPRLYGSTPTPSDFTWVKPRGVSHVYMMLIGAGGRGDGVNTGGGSGAVTVWYGAAQNVPDNLLVQPGMEITRDTTVGYRGTSLVTLLTASSASTATAGAASSANQFAASGFFQSIAGQNGTNGISSASATTFLSGGAGSTRVDSNYGYTHGINGAGFFQMQPIIVGSGGGNQFSGGIGCGSGPNVPGTINCAGGPGMVLIASW